MSTLATLVVKLVADASDLVDGLDTSAKKTGRFMDSLGKNVQAVGAGALAGLAGIGAAAAATGAALAGMTIDAAPIEGVSKAFEGLAQSAGIGADEMLAALKRGSSGMVSNRDLMLSFNKAASLVSTDFAVQLPDAMEYLSKVSASTGQDMGFLMDSLVTGVGRMSPMILDNLGIQVDLAQATDRAAEMFGVEAGALTDAQKQAGMMDVVLEKLRANTASMPDTTQSAAAKMAQFKATIQDTKDQIGAAFLPVLSEVMSGLGNLASTILPPVVDFMTQLGEKMQPVVQAFGDFVGRLVEGTDPMTAFQVLLMELLPPDMFVKVNEIVTAIDEFIGKASDALQPVTDWLGENIKLEDILAALGLAIMTVVIPALSGIVAAAAPVVGTFLLAVAIVAGLREAWENNFLGIRDITAQVLDWIKGKWETYSKQIEDVWAFMQNNLFPLFQALGDFMNTAFSLAITALAGLWENVLQPALQKVWEWINNKLSPVFKSLGDQLEGPFGKAVTWLKDNVLDPLANTFGNISGAIQEVIGWISGLTGKLQSITLPDWLTPGSPTPFEIGLWGINDALKALSHQGLPQFTGELSGIPSMDVGADLGATLGANNNSRVMNVTINTEQSTNSILTDLLLVEAMI